ncbi:MAG: hypothetical protein P4M11_04855 [Candidatus Pacebacteria bacterium]|nr:hypothetical protein [Candidatus Paceibacterota bacterium]
MIPYKYKQRKIRSIALRNLKDPACYFVRILGKNNEFPQFQSKPSGLTSNPSFEIGETDLALMNGFYSLNDCTTPKIILDSRVRAGTVQGRRHIRSDPAARRRFDAAPACGQEGTHESARR